MKPRGLLMMGDNSTGSILKAFISGDFHLVQEESINGAIERLEQDQFVWMIADLDLLRADEISALRQIPLLYPELKVYVITSNHEWIEQQNQRDNGYKEIIESPFNINEMVERIGHS